MPIGIGNKKFSHLPQKSCKPLFSNETFYLLLLPVADKSKPLGSGGSRCWAGAGPMLGRCWAFVGVYTCGLAGGWLVL